MESLSDNSTEIYSPNHFGAVGSFLMDKTVESILVRGLEQILVIKSGQYEEVSQKIEHEYQLNEILFDVKRFAILTSTDDILSTFVLPDGVICQVMQKSHNNPQPIILFELPVISTTVLDSQSLNYIGDDAATFLNMALDASLSLVICGDRERANLLGGLTHGVRADYTLVDIVCGPSIPSNIERTFTLNYIVSSGWAKMIGPDQIIPLALAYRPQCIRIGEIGAINLSALFTQYSGQVLLGMASSSLDDALNHMQSFIPNWFQHLSFQESVDQFARRLPLLVYAARSHDGSPVIQSIAEIKALNGALSSKIIYRREPISLRPTLLRTSPDSSIGNYLAGRMNSPGEWGKSWVIHKKSQKRPGIIRVWRRFINFRRRAVSE